MQGAFHTYKEKGNDLLKTVMKTLQTDQERLAPVIAKDRLTQALGHYWSAHYQASQAQDGVKNEQLSSVNKNMMQAHKLWLDLDLSAGEDEIRLYHFDELMKHMNEAIYYGLSSQSQQWIQHLVNSGKEFFKILEGILVNQTSEFKSDFYEKLFQKTNKESCVLLMRLAYKLTDAFYKVSVKQLEEDTGRSVKEAYRVIQKADQYQNILKELFERHANEYEAVSTFQNKCSQETSEEYQLAKDIYKLSITCKVRMEMAEGKRCFDRGVNEAEVLDMDELYASLDAYNIAGKLAYENKDTELEAQTEAMIGKIWYKALKKEDKARTHLYSATKLANTLYPKNVAGETWYKLASQYLQEVRDKQSAAEAAANAEKHAKFYEQIKDKLEPCVQAKKSGPKAFLNHLNDNILAQADKFAYTEEDMKETNIKKTIVRMIAKVHPDKHSNDEEHIQYLFSEITKLLNQVYELFK